MAGPSPDGLSYLLDDSPNSFALTPGFLTPYPKGLFALGGNDFIVGSSDAEIISGDNGNDRILGDSNSDTLLLFSVDGNDEYRIVTANRALRQLLHRHRPSSVDRELTGMRMREFLTDVLGLPHDRVRQTHETFRRAIATGAPVSYENMDWDRADQIAEVLE